jgi:hypothetical protein
VATGWLVVAVEADAEGVDVATAVPLVAGFVLAELEAATPTVLAPPSFAALPPVTPV